MSLETIQTDDPSRKTPAGAGVLAPRAPGGFSGWTPSGETARTRRFGSISAALLSALLAGLMAFDKRFSYLHIWLGPIPLFISEAVLGALLGVWVYRCLAERRLVFPASQKAALFALGLLWLSVLVGIARSPLPPMADLVAAFKRSALAYYSVFAFLFIALRQKRDVERILRWMFVGSILALVNKTVVLLTPAPAWWPRQVAVANDTFVAFGVLYAGLILGRTERRWTYAAFAGLSASFIVAAQVRASVLAGAATALFLLVAGLMLLRKKSDFLWIAKVLACGVAGYFLLQSSPRIEKSGRLHLGFVRLALNWWPEQSRGASSFPVADSTMSPDRKRYLVKRLSMALDTDPAVVASLKAELARYGPGAFDDAVGTRAVRPVVKLPKPPEMSEGRKRYLIKRLSEEGSDEDPFVIDSLKRELAQYGPDALGEVTGIHGTTPMSYGDRKQYLIKRLSSGTDEDPEVIAALQKELNRYRFPEPTPGRRQYLVKRLSQAGPGENPFLIASLKEELVRYGPEALEDVAGVHGVNSKGASPFAQPALQADGSPPHAGLSAPPMPEPVRPGERAPGHVPARARVVSKRAAAPSKPQETVPAPLDRPGSSNAMWRLHVWKAAIDETIQEHPWWGAGIDRPFVVRSLAATDDPALIRQAETVLSQTSNFYTRLKKDGIAAVKSFEPHMTFPPLEKQRLTSNHWYNIDLHNSHLAIFYRFGMVGIAAYLGLLLLVAQRLFSALRTCSDRRTPLFFLSFLLWYFVVSAFSVALEGPYLGIPFWVTLGAALVWTGRTEP